MAYSTIKDPSAHFQTSIWTGNATSRTIDLDSNSTMQPDFSWVKSRSNAYEHYWQNSSTGTDKYLRSNSSAAQQNGTIVTYNSTGFGIGSGAENNVNGTTNVGWFWKANGGTTTSVSASGTGSGCVNACTYQANTTAGFSIITYTGRDDQLSNGQESKLTHGLGAAPDATIMKRTDGTADWFVMGAFGGANGYPYSNNQYAKLNGTETINGNYFVGDTAPDATHIFLGNALVNTASATYVCYAFAEKQGYSKFGKYVGNGSANGTFVYTGFKPAFVMTKNISASDSWVIMDAKRSPSNVANKYLLANTSGAEGTSFDMFDLLSNGFKCRRTTSQNASGNTFIYMAFAENPFVAGGIPTTAR